MIHTASAVYEMDSTGVDGELEAIGIVHAFCSTGCRHFWLAQAGNAGEIGTSEFSDGTQCEFCGDEVGIDIYAGTKAE